MITVGASYINFGSGNVVIALAIATVKATLVALFFMHLAEDKPVNAIIAIAGFMFLGIFLMFDLDRHRLAPGSPFRRIMHLPTLQAVPVPGTAAPAAAPGAAPAAKKE